MSPLRFTFQFLALALVLGTMLAFYDRPHLLNSQAPPVFASAENLPGAQGLYRLQLVSTKDNAFQLSSHMQLSAPLGPSLAARDRRALAALKVSRAPIIDTASLLGFIPSPRQKPGQAIANRENDLEPRAASIKTTDVPTITSKALANKAATISALNQQGYGALARGERLAALASFERSLALDPNQPLILAQLGYAYKDEGRFRAAGDFFARASALAPTTGGQPGIAREASALKRSLRLSGYTIWRQDSRPEAEISFGPSLAQSQSGIAAAFRLPLDGWASQQDLSIYTRLLWAYDPMSFRLNDQSFQSGIGVQVRPFSGLNLVAAAERLISLGDQSRDDWLFRASYSAGQGYGPLARERTWLHWSLYSDVALIDPSNPDLQLTGEGRVGMGQRPFDSASFSVIPFAGLSANYQDASGVSTSLVEAGGGVWMRYWPGGADIPDPLRALDMRLEYRAKLAGDSVSNSGVRVTLGVTY